MRMMNHAWAWLLAVAYAIPFGAVGIKLNGSDSDEGFKPVVLREGEGVQGSKCYEEMRKGRPTLVYLSRGVPYQGLWERTFLNELLHGVGDILICELPGEEAHIREVLQKSGDDPVGFIVAGYPEQMLLTDLIEPIRMSAKKPRVLFHFSDERGKYKPTEIYPQIMPNDGLVLRQYQFWSDLPAAPLTRVMPLGYDLHLDLKGDSCAAAIKNAAGGLSKRSYKWAFVSGMHATSWERDHATNMVSELLGLRRVKATEQLDSKDVFVGQKEGSEMLEVYKQAVFAPILQGRMNNESRRVYDSVIAGAIPVIVGSDMQSAYGFHSWSGKMPPFLFAPTWTDARNQMNSLLENKSKLEALHAHVPTWYCEWIRGIQTELVQRLSR